MTPFDWHDFLSLANETGDEAAQRTAISCGYYANLALAALPLLCRGQDSTPCSGRQMLSAGTPFLIETERNEGRGSVI